MKKQLKDLEKRKRAEQNEKDAAKKKSTEAEMAELIETLNNMAQFVNENNECVKHVLEKELEE